jgi:predicted nucleic acid-binding protein
MAASQLHPTAPETGPTTIPVVLDTNVVLGWLVFSDPRLTPLAAAVEAGQLRWLACPRMRAELALTLSYPALGKWKPDSERTLASFDRWAQLLPDPPAPQASPLLCSDPDDQVFIELALAHQAAWLLTRDRALLKLKRRAAGRGLQIAPPESWAAAQHSPVQSLTCPA